MRSREACSPVAQPPRRGAALRAAALTALAAVRPASPSLVDATWGVLRCERPYLRFTTSRGSFARRWCKAEPPGVGGGGAARGDAAEYVALLEDFGRIDCDGDACEVSQEPDDLNSWEEDSRKASFQKLLEDPSGEFASVDSAEVRRFAAFPSGFTLNALEISADGNLWTRIVTRGELLETTPLRSRDLRTVITPPAPGSDAGQTILHRKNTWLISIGGLRAIVNMTHGLLLSPDAAATPRFLRVLEAQLQSRDAGGPCLEGLFPLVFTESALFTLARRLEAKLLRVRQTTEPLLSNTFEFRGGDMDVVRQQRRLLLRYRAQAEATLQALIRRLDADEPIHSEQERQVHSEWEEMLEGGLQVLSSLVGECRRLLDDIEDFEGAAALALSERRLRVEEFELVLIISSISVTAGALITGVFGMNLRNGSEDSQVAFVLACFVVVVVGVGLFGVLRQLAVREGVLGTDPSQTVVRRPAPEPPEPPESIPF